MTWAVKPGRRAVPDDGAAPVGGEPLDQHLTAGASETDECQNSKIWALGFAQGLCFGRGALPVGWSTSKSPSECSSLQGRVELLCAFFHQNLCIPVVVFLGLLRC